MPMHPELAADCREALDLLRQYAELTKPDGSDWPLLCRIEQIANRMSLNGQHGAARAILGAYNRLQKFVKARMRLTDDATNRFSAQNYHPVGHPARVSAEASNAERRKLLTGYPVRRDAIFSRLEAELDGFGVDLAPAHRVAA
jgi:hypothetical protein